MLFIFCSILIVIICILIWFLIPYSPLKAEFEKNVKVLSENVVLENKTFSKEVLSTKPELLQRFIAYCGLYNAPQMKSAFTEHNNADFLLKDDSPLLKMQYTQVNFATICERAAFIDSRLGSVLPFQGLDDNRHGKGRMKGVIAKLCTVFNVRGTEMDMAALVTVLAEGIMCPSFLMHSAILWEEIDSTHLQATLTYYGMSVSGIFAFDDDGAILSFYTKDRYEENKGTMTRRDWKVECGDYKEIDGIKRPTIFRALWVYPTYEKKYFDCSSVVVRYEY